MTSTKESTKGLDTSTQDNEVSWREKFKNGLKQGEVKWAIGAVVTLLWLRALLLWLTGLNDFEIIYGYVVLSLLIIYLLAFLACVTSLFESCSFFIAYVIFAATIFLTISNQAMSSVILAVVTAPAMLLLRKVFSEHNFGRKVLGNLLLSSSIIFVLWQIFMPDSDEKALNIKGLAHVFEVYYRNFTNIVCLKCDIFSNQSPLLELGNRVVFVIALGVFIYTALICTAIKSFLRWVLYFIAGFGALFTGVSYFHDSSITIQIASFWLFLVVFCVFFSLIRNDQEKKYSKPSEQLGLTSAYNKLYALIRRFLKGEDQKAVLLWGRWGMGKTHCIRYLAYRLSMKHPEENEQGKNENGEGSGDDDESLNACNAFVGKVKICKVNLWEYSSREDAWNAIIQALGRTILGRYSLFHSVMLNKYLPSVMRSIFSGNIIGSLYELVFLSDRDRDKELCKQLSDEIGCNDRIVLIFDNVERANFQIINALPPLIEKLSQIKRLMVICSLAKDELAKVHQREINQGKDKEFALENLTGYIIKVFDYSFQIPDIVKEYCKKFVDIKLEEKIHGNECDLTKDFMGKCGFLFTTPRQVERSIELLMGIELQYKASIVDDEEKGNSPKEERRNLLYKKKSHIIFLVEIMKMFYPQVLHVAQLYPGGPVQFAQKVVVIAEWMEPDEESDLTDARMVQIEKFRGNNEYIYGLIRTDYLVIDLLKALKDCSSKYVDKAIKGEYKRRLPLTSKEIGDAHKKSSNDSGGVTLRSQERDPYKLGLFEYCMNHLSESFFLVLFNQLVDEGRFERDRGIFQDDGITFLYSREHFFHLLYIYSQNFVRNKEVINTILKMFDRASADEKVNILREFCTDKLPFEFKDTVPFVFHDYIEKISCGKIIDLVKEMYIRYIKDIVQDIAYLRIRNEKIVKDHYRTYHFYDLLKREDFIEDCTIEVPEDTIDEGIVNLIDFVTLRSGFSDGYDGKQMATSKFKANIILPALRAWFKTHSVNLLISERIDEWIKKSDDAIDYWKGDRTGLDELRKYAEGARSVKKFLEGLKAKKESHEENETEKTSE